MKDWQAWVLAYGVALLLAETEAAPLAVIGSWAIVLTELYAVVSGGSGGILSGLTGGYPQSGSGSGSGQSVPQLAGNPASQAASGIGFAPGGGSGGAILVPPSLPPVGSNG